jgi:ABC-type glycerol-3-phosphate transport system substrate-binding protein
MRKYLLVLVVFGMVLAAAGVHAQGGDLSGVDPSGVTITYWNQYNSGAQQEVMNTLIEKFNSTNQWGITVNGIAQGNYTDLRNLMTAAIVSGELPNLVAGYQNDAASYYLDDAALDLNPYYNDATWGYSESDRADLNTDIINIDVFSEYGGAMLAWPNQVSADVLAVNLDMLKSLGFDAAPQDFDTFKAVACAAAKAENTQGYPIKLDSSNFESMVASRGGNIFHDGQYDFTSDAVIQTFTFYKDLYDSGCAYIPESAFGNTDDFALGANPMALGSSAGVPFIISGIQNAGLSFNWSVTTTPWTDDNRTVQVFVPSIIVVPSTPEQNLASWLFLKFLTEADSQQAWAAATDYFPIRHSVAEKASEFMDASNPVSPFFQEANALLNDPSIHIYFSTQNLTYGSVRDLVSSAMADVTTNGKDVQPVAEQLQKDANALLTNQ